MVTERTLIPCTGKTHDQFVEEERKKFDSDWLVFTEIGYHGYVYDLLAFNPQTKEVSILEVDLSHQTEKEKITFTETFATLKIIRIIRSDNHWIGVQSRTFQPMLKALSNSTRIGILDYLYDEGKRSYNDLMNILKMTQRDSGRFAYHLNALLKNDLVSKEDKFYKITEKGTRLIDFFRNFDNC